MAPYIALDNTLQLTLEVSRGFVGFRRSFSVPSSGSKSVTESPKARETWTKARLIIQSEA